MILRALLVCGEITQQTDKKKSQGAEENERRERDEKSRHKKNINCSEKGHVMSHLHTAAKIM